MEKKRFKIVAVCGSPVAGGNVEAFLDHALDTYRDMPEVEVARFDLSGMEIGACTHCNWCMKKQEPGRYCGVQDDMASIYPELLEADGLIVATPVHFLRLSGTTADFIDRLRLFSHGNITKGAMRNKVGAALAVSWFRNAGVDLALVTVNNAFQVLTMVIATPDEGILGAGACSSLEGGGRIRKDLRTHVSVDELGLAQARSCALRVHELIRLLDAGGRALAEETPG
ncbi:MAG: flavodoxin family protein [Actinobacteria bacterium]|nr:flavodoxin family protein [Actinomycetota bacterium]MBU1943888.1 flavodoxin family protein [Actinomycetota bacterium]MBU2688590.1 flavodoxin family protein [Actinomycetota bacterium]